MIYIWILKALAYVFTFVLLIISVVLFAPIRYRLNADYKGKLGLHVKASWILRIFTLIYDTDFNPAFKLTIFGRTGRKKKDRHKKTHHDSDEDNQDIQKTEQESTETQKEDDNAKRSKLGDLKAHWHKVIDYPYKDLLVKKTLLFAKRFIKALLPTQADGECCFGFDDPSATGMLLGAAHAFLGITDLYNRVSISADFEKKYLYLKCHIAGKVTLWSLCWPFVAYALSKPVWIIIKPMIFKQKTKG